jgi:hypothetical protein
MVPSIRSARNTFAGALWCALFVSAAHAQPPAESNYHIYVAPEGSDGNMGSKDSPFKSIARAATLAVPGTTVHVAPGVYEGGFKTTASGDATGRIVYLSAEAHGARIVTPRDSASTIAWDNRGNDVDIVGFDIDGAHQSTGTPWLHGIYNAGSNVGIRNNHVHHIGLAASCASAPSGIGVDSYYHGVLAEIAGNKVHDIGAINCNTAKGIYLNTTGTVKNNVAYAIGGAAIQLWHDAKKVVVANNTVANSSNGIVVGGGDFYFTKGPNDHTSVVNNIVYDNKFGIAEQGVTGKNNAYRNNLVYQNAHADWALKSGLVHSGTITAPPQFVRYLRKGTPDFHLLGSSPAIGRALPEQAATADFDGKARQKDRPGDIGAYQH